MAECGGDAPACLLSTYFFAGYCAQLAHDKDGICRIGMNKMIFDDLSTKLQ